MSFSERYSSSLFVLSTVMSIFIVSCVHGPKSAKIELLSDRQPSSQNQNVFSQEQRWSAYKTFWYQANQRIEKTTFGSSRNFYDLQKISFQSNISAPRSDSLTSDFKFKLDPSSLFAQQNILRFSANHHIKKTFAKPMNSIGKLEIPQEQVVDIVGMENQWLHQWFGDQKQDQDRWYRIFVPKAQAILNIDLRFQVYYGNLDLEVYDSNGNKLVESTEQTDDEYLMAESKESGVFYIRVKGNNQGNLFDLKWSIDQKWQKDDDYEENDSFAKAFDLAAKQGIWLSYVRGLGVNVDNDFYKIRVSKADSFKQMILDLRFDSTQGDLDLFVYNSRYELVASSTSNADDEFLSFSVPEPGDYWIKISQFSLSDLKIHTKVSKRPIWYDFKWDLANKVEGQSSIDVNCDKNASFVTRGSRQLRIPRTSSKFYLRLKQELGVPILIRANSYIDNQELAQRFFLLERQAILDLESAGDYLDLHWQDDGIPRKITFSCESGLSIID